ncbi:hypothetical protein [Streptomyces shenzhenensis]|uniref:hypothetical protein n=1 Tax=Streptomyces shenzhenensis TaxID=943815 RepID=UPI00217D8589|nr:hypothetical protein [Streptomyces shenzhenensis]
MSDEARQNTAESGATPGDAASPDTWAIGPAAPVRGGGATAPGGTDADGGATVVSWPAPAGPDPRSGPGPAAPATGVWPAQAGTDTGAWDAGAGAAPGPSASTGRETVPDPWAPPADRAPADISADATAPRPGVDPWAAPADTAPAPGASAAGPGNTVVAGGPGTPAPPAVHDQQTVTSSPEASAPPPWAGPAGTPPAAERANPFAAPGPGGTLPAAQPANPFAAPGTAMPPAAGPDNPFAPPSAESAKGAPFAPPAAQPQSAPVPPPPIAPGGPGQVPYGYPGGPAGYGYPAPHMPGPGYPVPPAAGPGSYGWPGMQPMPSNGLGTAGMVLGILAAIGFCMWPVAILLGVLAVIFGGIGRGRAHRGEATNPGQALAGVICGASGIVLALVMLAFLIAA